MDPLTTASDIIGLINGTNRILLALSGGPDRIDFVELSNEVRSYAATLKAVHNLLLQNESIAEQPALRDELEHGKRTLEYMAKMLEKYDNHLRPGGSGSRIKDSIMRIRWSLSREEISKIQADLRAHAARLGLLLNVAQMNSTSPSEAEQPEIIIAVMGPTGAGKSRLIHEVTGSSTVRVGHGLASETQIVQAHSITIDNRVITLVDTPGFDDSFRGDAEILQEVAAWFAESYQSARRLTAVIYLQPITSTRVTGSMIKNLKVFTEIVGLNNFSNVILVTTMWDRLEDVTVAERREQELLQTFWAPLIEKGCVTARFSGDRASALQIIGRIAFDQCGSFNPPLAIQREMIDERKKLEETAAGEALLKQMLEMERKHAAELSRVRSDAQEQVNVMAKRVQAEIDTIRGEQAHLKASLAGAVEREKMATRFQDDWDRRFETLQNRMSQIKGQDGIDLPPPYCETLAGSDSDTRKGSSSGLVNFGLSILWNSIAFSKNALQRALRPKIPEGMTRIEWTCSCGDQLYSDFKEMSPGSLQVFAARLGGSIVNSQNLARGPAPQSTAAGPAVPPPAHGQGSQPSSSPPKSSSSSPATGSSGVPVPQISYVLSAGAIQSTPARKKFLEICVWSHAGFHKLGEIDVSGYGGIPPSDRTVFEKIKARYDEDRTLVRVFGRFALHQPKAGNFVKFRIDKNPYVAIVKAGPPVPPLEEVDHGQYLYDPVPMDEPPMDPEIFMHFFSKVTLAHNEAIWTTRFPQKLDNSLFYGAKPLTVGWGIQIAEGPNWLLFSTCMLIALLISGAVAALYGHFAKDIPSGITIGTWLTAVQGLVLTILLFVWS